MNKKDEIERILQEADKVMQSEDAGDNAKAVIAAVLDAWTESLEEMKEKIAVLSEENERLKKNVLLLTKRVHEISMKRKK